MAHAHTHTHPHARASHKCTLTQIATSHTYTMQGIYIESCNCINSSAHAEVHAYRNSLSPEGKHAPWATFALIRSIIMGNINVGFALIKYMIMSNMTKGEV